MSDTPTPKRRGRPPSLTLSRVPASVFDVPRVLENGQELPPKARLYLEYLAGCGTSTQALARAGTSWSQLLRWRKQFGDEFRELEAAARELAIDTVEFTVLQAVTSGKHIPAATARLAQFVLERRRDTYQRPETRAKVEARVELAGARDWVELMRLAEAQAGGAAGDAGDGGAPAGEETEK